MYAGSALARELATMVQAEAELPPTASMVIEDWRTHKGNANGGE